MNIKEANKIQNGTLTFVHRDKFGKIKPLFNRNTFGRFLLEKGFTFKIPFLTGRYKDSLTLNLKQ